ncbi:hypothetical protein [Acinetobacter towneri]|uniref:hypothetical protein n=1 Tax=Acinetobacter towneri TaxID=202956 RepID=UPI00257554FF|nr:hypothetical protein [Acinetobacter towneri]
MILLANKIDQYLIRMSFFSALSSQRWLKLSPISADNSWDKNPPILYALAHINISPLRLSVILEFSYDESHTGTGCSRTENNNNKFIHQDREVRQESYLATQYEKPRQDAGVFYCLYFPFNQSIETKYGGIKSIRYIKAIAPAVIIPNESRLYIKLETRQIKVLITPPKNMTSSFFKPNFKKIYG